jgi:hypothetical protein
LIALPSAVTTTRNSTGRLSEQRDFLPCDVHARAEYLGDELLRAELELLGHALPD